MQKYFVSYHFQNDYNTINKKFHSLFVTKKKEEIKYRNGNKAVAAAKRKTLETFFSCIGKKLLMNKKEVSPF